MLQQKKSSANLQQNLQQKDRNEVKQYGSYKAYSLIALSSICLTIMQLTFKQLTKHFSPPLILGIRGGCSFMLNVFFMRNAGLSFSVKDPVIFRMLVKRAVVSYLTVTLYISSIKYIPLGIANALHNTSPIIAFFVEVFYYKKTKIHWINLIITIFCFIGVLLIVQPQFLFGSSKTSTSDQHKIYYLMVLSGAFLSAFSAIFMHDLSGKVHQLVALQYGYLSQSLFNSLFFILFVGINQVSFIHIHGLSLNQIGRIIINFIFMIFFSLGAQYTRTISFFMCYPALVMPFNFLSILFGLLIDIFVFQSKNYNTTIIVGMILASMGLFSKFIILKLRKNQYRKQQIVGK